MTVKQGSKEWRELTFSQRVGEAPLTDSFQIGELTPKFRNLVWHAVSQDIDSCTVSDDVSRSLSGETESYFERDELGDFWKEFIPELCMKVLDLPHDSYERSPAGAKKALRQLILKGEYHLVLSAIEQIVRLVPFASLIENLTEYFRYTAYTLVGSSRDAYIIPAASEEAKKSISNALENINNKENKAVKAGLRKAAEAINRKAYRDSVRESVNALEASARRVDPEGSNSLGKAISHLQDSDLINHEALAKTFSSLYGYASDQARHTPKKAVEIDMEEAIFVYTACISFIDYLNIKHRKLQESAKKSP